MKAITGEARMRLVLPLLQALTAEVADWYLWKNADSALTGRGDVDSQAPPSSWPAIKSVFARWAAFSGMRYVLVCCHIPRTLNLFAIHPHSNELLQLEVKAVTTFRGARLFSAEDLVQLTCIDPRGFRRLRPGAEGLLKLLTNGVRRGGGPDREGLAQKHVLELLETDPSGVNDTAKRLRLPATMLLDVVDGARSGSWNRRAAQAVELAGMVRALSQPLVLAERLWFRAIRKPFCPVLRIVYAGRQLPADQRAWLARVGLAHEVTGVS